MRGIICLFSGSLCLPQCRNADLCRPADLVARIRTGIMHGVRKKPYARAWPASSVGPAPASSQHTAAQHGGTPQKTHWFGCGVSSIDQLLSGKAQESSQRPQPVPAHSALPTPPLTTARQRTVISGCTLWRESASHKARAASVRSKGRAPTRSCRRRPPATDQQDSSHRHNGSQCSITAGAR